MSGIVVVDELSTSSGTVSGILGSGNGCDVVVVVSAGRVGTDCGTVGTVTRGTVVDVVSSTVVEGSGKEVVVVVGCSNKEVDELLVVV